jgi:hypothetical protein
VSGNSSSSSGGNSSSSLPARRVPRRALSENLSAAHAGTAAPWAPEEVTAERVPLALDRQPSLVPWAEPAEGMLAGGRHVPLPESSPLTEADAAAADDDAAADAADELSFAEQQLLRCVALALSAADGPPPELLRECAAGLGEDARLVARLVKVLARMRRHASRVGHQRVAAAAARGGSFTNRRGGSGGVRGGLLDGSGAPAGHRLPCVGFETLAALCQAALKACAARSDFATPYALLQLTGAYYQRVRAAQPESSPELQVEPLHDSGWPNSHALGPGGSQGGVPASSLGALNGRKESRRATPGDEIEYLSARVCEHHVYSDLRLWEHVLSVDLARCKPSVPSPFAAPLATSNGQAEGGSGAAAGGAGGSGGGGRAGAVTPPNSGAHASAAAAFVTPNPRSGAERSSGALATNGPLELSAGEKRAVVQRVTLLLYSMRGIGMTPHRAVLLVNVDLLT